MMADFYSSTYLKLTLERYCNAVTTYGELAGYEANKLREYIGSDDEIPLDRLVEEAHRMLFVRAVTRRLIK